MTPMYHNPTSITCMYHPCRPDTHVDQCRCVATRPSQRPTVPCPAPARVQLAACRPHDARRSAAAILAAPPAPRRRHMAAVRRDLRVALAVLGFILAPLLAHAAPQCTRTITTSTAPDGSTVIRVHRVCIAPTKK